jgi:hypothetical protein
MLDYGYRSRCCFAPIRLGRKKIKKLNKTVMIWVCTKCLSRDVDIIPKDGSEVQVDKLPFSERS